MKTPSFLVELDVMKANIEKVSRLAKFHGKKLAPMTKTHKSVEIAKMQIEAGATELLVGTFAEAKAFEELGVRIVFAYPIVNKTVLGMIKDLRCDCTFSVDDIKQVELLDKFGFKDDVLVIVDCGLHRLGVKSDKLLELVKSLNRSNLKFKGIACHAGQVYKALNNQEVKAVAIEELAYLKEYNRILIEHGLKEYEVCSGTTPTFFELVASDFITTFRPGNYVYNDAIQVALGVAIEADCALRVVGSVISNPEEGKYILDIGSKCLGLDKGAHGNSAIEGYGLVVGKEAIISSLSEEVSIMLSDHKFCIGELVEVIPNHSCSANNMTSKLWVRGSNRFISVDARSNS